MDPIQIKLSAIWAAVMLTYLLGDVLRIFSGDFEPGKIGGERVPGSAWLVAAALMLGPILMLILSLFLDHPINRWANILLAAFYFVFNLIGLPTYPGAYDKFLLGVSLVFNLITIWLAWSWS
jgi:hypothetical protein